MRSRYRYISAFPSLVAHQYEKFQKTSRAATAVYTRLLVYTGTEKGTSIDRLDRLIASPKRKMKMLNRVVKNLPTQGVLRGPSERGKVEDFAARYIILT
jgi:hypothetical protein